MRLQPTCKTEYLGKNILAIGCVEFNIDPDLFTLCLCSNLILALDVFGEVGNPMEAEDSYRICKVRDSDIS